MSVGRLCRRPLFFDQPLGQRDEFLAVLPAAQGEKASHQAETDGRRLIHVKQSKLWRHLDTIHY